MQASVTQEGNPHSDVHPSQRSQRKADPAKRLTFGAGFARSGTHPVETPLRPVRLAGRGRSLLFTWDVVPQVITKHVTLPPTTARSLVDRQSRARAEPP